MNKLQTIMRNAKRNVKHGERLGQKLKNKSHHYHGGGQMLTFNFEKITGKFHKNGALIETYWHRLRGERV